MERLCSFLLCYIGWESDYVENSRRRPQQRQRQLLITSPSPSPSPTLDCASLHYFVNHQSSHHRHCHQCHATAPAAARITRGKKRRENKRCFGVIWWNFFNLSYISGIVNSIITSPKHPTDHVIYSNARGNCNCKLQLQLLFLYSHFCPSKYSSNKENDSR